VLLKSFGAWYSLITLLTIASYVAFTFLVTEWRTKYRRMMNEKENDSSNRALDALINFEVCAETALTISCVVVVVVLLLLLWWLLLPVTTIS
jgi:ABC-type transport system involved in Fe-S cluster assembly fused permease/ATPase subunit